jgi:hypothetical protein
MRAKLFGIEPALQDGHVAESLRDSEIRTRSGVDDSDADDGLGIAVAFWAIYWRHRKKRLQYEERQEQFGWPQRDSDPNKGTRLKHAG